MNKFIRQLQISNGIIFHALFKIFVAVINRFNAMVEIHHGAYTIKPEPIKMKLLQPIFQIGEQKSCSIAPDVLSPCGRGRLGTRLNKAMPINYICCDDVYTVHCTPYC